MKQSFLEKIANMTKAYFQQHDKEMPSPEILANLQQEFSHKKQKKNLLMQPIPLWQAGAAAAVLLIAWGLQFWYFKPVQPVANTVYVPVHDTVKLTEIVREIDTFFQTIEIEKRQNPHNENVILATNQSIATDSPALAVSTPIQARNVALNTDVNILNVRDFEKQMQKKSGKSWQEDSLGKQFGFVSM